MNSHITYDSDTTSGSNNVHDTSQTYSVIGGRAELASAVIDDGRYRTVDYKTDLSGQVIRRDESDNNTTLGDPHELWYRAGGREMGYVGNNGTQNVQQHHAVTQRVAEPGTGAFRNGADYGALYTDFDQSYEALNTRL